VALLRRRTGVFECSFTVVPELRSAQAHPPGANRSKKLSAVGEPDASLTTCRSSIHLPKRPLLMRRFAELRMQPRARNISLHIAAEESSNSGLVQSGDSLQLVQSHNHNDSDAKRRNKVWTTKGGACNEKRSTLPRDGFPVPATGRVQSKPKLKLLAEAEYWEHLAQAEMSSHFKECNTTSSSERARPLATSNANDTRCETVAAA